jgi:hypothetical protein
LKRFTTHLKVFFLKGLLSPWTILLPCFWRNLPLNNLFVYFFLAQVFFFFFFGQVQQYEFNNFTNLQTLFRFSSSYSTCIFSSSHLLYIVLPQSCLYHPVILHHWFPILFKTLINLWSWGWDWAADDQMRTSKISSGNSGYLLYMDSCFCNESIAIDSLVKVMD